MFGAGGGTSSYREAEETDLIVLWGSNARETHPIFFHHLLRGVRNGARLIAVDPRRTSSAEWADLWLGLDVGSDIALANAVAREIIASGLEHREFIDRATVDFEAYKAKVESYTLDYAERETGVPADAIRELAHALATAPRAMICWTLGITEHHNAVDNVLALINLVLLTGHVGRYGSGVNPLRGQNNVQGGGDMGALPDRLPGFQHVENDELRAKFDAEWGVAVPPKRGWHLSGMFDAMERGELTAVYCIGENPVQSEADQKRAIGLLVRARLPGRPGPVPDEDRRARRRRPAGHRGLGRIGGHGHQLRAARPARPQGGRAAGGARDDLAIIFELANRMGAGWGEADAETGLERGPPPLAGPCRDELRAPRGRGRPPVAVLRRDAPGRALPPLAAVGGPGPGQSRAVRPGRPRPAGRQARRRLPDPADDRAPAGLVQHGRPVRRLHLAAAARREPGHQPGGRRRPTAWPTANGSGSSPAAARWRSRSGSTNRSGRA